MVAVYFLINFIFLIGVFLLSFFGHKSGHNPALYLVLLVALLTSPLLFVRSIAGPYIVLVVAVPFFFLMYGMGDLVGYFSDVAWFQVDYSGSMLSYGEGGILVAILSLFIGTVAAVHTLKARSERWFVTDWPVRTALIVGLLFFAIGMVATFIFQIQFSAHQLTTASNMSPLALNAVVLSRMVGQLSEVLLAYVLVRTRSKAIMTLIVALIAFKLPLGIILNAKYIGVSFIMAYLVVAWIYNKRVPWKIVIFGGVAIALMFSLAYQYRTYMGKYHVTVAETLENISGNLGKALTKNAAGQDKRGVKDAVLGGLESIAARANMKPAVELIMSRAGKDLPYQDGYTLAPLFYILIPRMVLPDKPAVSVGRLFNHEFQISESPDTHISTSFIGELYWNFSWIGIIVGMLIVGYTFGAVGSVANMDACANVTKLLIVLVTIATLVFKFQTGIAQQYSLFVRSFIIIVVLHALFSRRKGKQDPA